MSEENIDKLAETIKACFMDAEFMEDVWKYFLNEIDGWDKTGDHSEEDHECMLNMYVRFDRETGNYENTEYQNSDQTNQPFSTESTVVVAIMVCPGFDNSKDQMQTDFIQMIDQVLYD
ncbi:hypothetical protein LCGC14_0175500 [marine sediment metagenome]|uniref:Uncharacterized protein n=1 Tax=marine sediment metagenome TaxID=412755 RepID=A0A0F9X9L7_9ZZZZ